MKRDSEKEKNNHHQHRVFIPAHLDDAGLSPAQYRVYCHFGRHKVGFSPAMKKIATTCQLRDDTVRGAIRYLVGRQMIELIETPGRARQYIVTSAEMWIAAEEGKPVRVFPKQAASQARIRCSTEAGHPLVNATSSVKPQATTPPLELGESPRHKEEGDLSLPTRVPMKDNMQGKEKRKQISTQFDPTAFEPDPSPPSNGERENETQAVAGGDEKTAFLTAAIAIGAIMRRGEPPSQWSKNEKNAFCKLCDERGIPSTEEIASVALRYEAEWPPREGNYIRRHLLTLLGNWSKEVIRAGNVSASLSSAPLHTTSDDQSSHVMARRKDEVPRQGYIIPKFCGPLSAAEYLARFKTSTH